MKKLVLAITIVCLGIAGCRGDADQKAAPGARQDTEPGAQAGRDAVRRFEGMYTYYADAARFTPCGSDVSYPVAMEEDNVALENAYAPYATSPGALVFVTLFGYIAPRPKMEGEGTEEQLVPTRFERVWPEETCEKKDVRTPLDNTYWKLVEIDGQAVPPPAQDAREAHIKFRADGMRVEGFGGCNGLGGTYEVTGAKLSLGPLVGTLMACPESDREAAFHAALEKVTTYRIQGETLDLRSDTGSVARFRAVYF